MDIWRRPAARRSPGDHFSIEKSRLEFFAQSTGDSTRCWQMAGHCHHWASPANVRFWQILLQKSFWGGERKFSERADAFSGRRREGPDRFIQNRSRTSVVARKGDAAAEKSKDQLWRDFQDCSIFDFCNNIGTKRT